MSKELKKHIRDFCKAFNIVNYKINPDLSVDVDGDVDISYIGIGEMPFNFNNVTGNFNASYNYFTDMYNGPKQVGGIYDVSFNDLESFSDFPLTAGKGVLAYHNEFELANSFPSVQYQIEVDNEVKGRIIKSQRLITLNNIFNS